MDSIMLAPDYDYGPNDIENVKMLACAVIYMAIIDWTERKDHSAYQFLVGYHHYREIKQFWCDIADIDADILTAWVKQRGEDPEEYSSDFGCILYGDEMRRIRQMLRLTQSELSHILGCTQEYLSGVETGKYAVTPRTRKGKHIIKGIAKLVGNRERVAYS